MQSLHFDLHAIQAHVEKRFASISSALSVLTGTNYCVYFRFPVTEARKQLTLLQTLCFPILLTPSKSLPAGLWNRLDGRTTRISADRPKRSSHFQLRILRHRLQRKHLMTSQRRSAHRGLQLPSKTTRVRSTRSANRQKIQNML